MLRSSNVFLISPDGPRRLKKVHCKLQWLIVYYLFDCFNGFGGGGDNHHEKMYQEFFASRESSICERKL